MKLNSRKFVSHVAILNVFLWAAGFWAVAVAIHAECRDNSGDFCHWARDFEWVLHRYQTVLAALAVAWAAWIFTSGVREAVRDRRMEQHDARVALVSRYRADVDGFYGRILRAFRAVNTRDRRQDDGGKTGEPAGTAILLTMEEWNDFPKVRPALPDVIARPDHAGLPEYDYMAAIQETVAATSRWLETMPFESRDGLIAIDSGDWQRILALCNADLTQVENRFAEIERVQGRLHPESGPASSS